MRPIHPGFSCLKTGRGFGEMRKSGQDLTIALIVAVAIIDAILIGVLRVRYVRSHSYDSIPHRSAPRAAPP